MAVGILTVCSLYTLLIICFGITVAKPTLKGNLIKAIILNVVVAIEIVCAVIFCDTVLSICFISFLAVMEFINIIDISMTCIFLHKKKREDKLQKATESEKLYSNSKNGKIVV